VPWNIITLLSNEKLLVMASAFLDADADAPVATTTKPMHRRMIWRLADKIDTEFLCDELIQVLDNIDQSISIYHQPCLVHCAQGQSRSVAVCAAYLLSRNHVTTLEDALDGIRKIRPQAEPNIGFLAALKAIEQEHGDVKNAIQRWGEKTPKNAVN
jgi:protein-tyrosine phosphatase